jgi:glycosyltransferase involved in cell wall biosynthesis
VTQEGQSTRVLQVVGAMNRGGAETWLMNVLRGIDRRRVRIDFLVHTNTTAAYDDEIRSFGSRVIHCPTHKNIPMYARQMGKILEQYGPYDAIHSHVHYFSGVTLEIAARANIPVRIAHSHTSQQQLDGHLTSVRKLYFGLMRSLIARYATIGLAASRQAAVALWGHSWQKDPRWQIFYCGIPLDPFSDDYDCAAQRIELGIPSKACVIGHVGNFHPVKNHAFLVQILSEITELHQDVYLLLIGEGQLRQEIEELAVGAKIRDKVIFAGARDDVPKLLRSSVNVFVFPSHFEGLPLSVVEAQAAGLPVIISDAVTHEVEIVPDLFTWLSLSQSVTEWAKACLFAGFQPRKMTRQDTVRILTYSAFNIQRGIEGLETIYEVGKHA